MFFDVLIDTVGRVLGALLLALIEVGGAWLLTKLAKHMETKNISAAVDEILRIAKMTVGDLQQTLVEGLKAAHEDGKLTEFEIKEIQTELMRRVKERMAPSTCNLITGAGIDLESLISGAAEDWLSAIKGIEY